MYQLGYTFKQETVTKFSFIREYYENNIPISLYIDVEVPTEPLVDRGILRMEMEKIFY